MATGIIYVMTTVVPGLIKIGKTATQNFESRMYQLEHNGYSNVTGLKRHFAIQVDDYDEKEALLHTIFSKSQVEATELFALDVNLVVQLLTSFAGDQVYPENKTKEEVFDEATGQRDISLIPEGEYYLERKIKRWNGKAVKATMYVKNGKFTVKKGSIICPIRGLGLTTMKIVDQMRDSAKVERDTLQEDVTFTSPSVASAFVVFASTNGWTDWKTIDGKAIDIFRKK